MARDYKHAGTRRRPAQQPPFSGWAGLTIGLTLGVALAVGVHLYHGDSRQSDDSRQSQIGSHEGDGNADGGANARRQPRFDFYRMLPNYEVVIPEEDIAVTPTLDQEPVAGAGNYVLQAGSFRSAADADRLRAQLALLGVESRVQTVTIDDADTWHRVRIGPMRDLRELNAAREKLAQNQIEVLVIRVGD